MEKFKFFIDKKINTDRFKEPENLKKYSLICENLPEQLEEFEEFEFFIDDIVMCLAVLEGKIKRIMFVKVDKEDSQICYPLTKEELSIFLDKNENNLLEYLKSITE